MVFPLCLYTTITWRFLFSHLGELLFSIFHVIFFLGLFPHLCGAWLPIVHRSLWEVNCFGSAMSKCVFISSFHLSWHPRLKILFPLNFEGIVPMVSNVEDILILILWNLFFVCLLWKLLRSYLLPQSSEISWWCALEQVYFHLFWLHLSRPFRLEI